MIASVALCVLALAGGMLIVASQSVAVEPDELRSLYIGWAVSVAATFIISVAFFILMLREGELGR